MVSKEPKHSCCHLTNWLLTSRCFRRGIVLSSQHKDCAKNSLHFKWKIIKQSTCGPEMSHVLFLVLQVIHRKSRNASRDILGCELHDSRQWLQIWKEKSTGKSAALVQGCKKINLQDKLMYKTKSSVVLRLQLHQTDLNSFLNVETWIEHVCTEVWFILVKVLVFN